MGSIPVAGAKQNRVTFVALFCFLTVRIDLLREQILAGSAIKTRSDITADLVLLLFSRFTLFLPIRIDTKNEL